MQHFIRYSTSSVALSVVGGVLNDAAAKGTTVFDPDINGAPNAVVNPKGQSPQQGIVSIGLYNSKNSYETRGIVRGERLDVTDTVLVLKLENLPAGGEHAIRALHDLNSDCQMGGNSVGITTELFTLSNDALGRFAPHSWKDAKFPATVSDTLLTPSFVQ
ncbi:MAG: DUF2141 domain-containing protein [Pseudomonadota bacterium]